MYGNYDAYASALVELLIFQFSACVCMYVIIISRGDDGTGQSSSTIC